MDLHGRPALVLCFHPQLDSTLLVNPGPVVVVSDAPTDVPGSPRVEWVRLRDFVPWRAHDVVTRLRPEVAVVDSLFFARPLQVAAAARAGVRWFHLVDGHMSSFPVNARGALAVTTATRLRARLAGLPGVRPLEEVVGVRLVPPWRTTQDTLEATRQAVAWAGSTAAAPPRRPRRVAMYVGSLGAGGAERQLSYLAPATRARGIDTTVLAAFSLEGSNGHYARTIEATGVPCHHVGFHRDFLHVRRHRDVHGEPVPPAFLALLDKHFLARYLLPLVERLEALRPDVLHCWLDEANIVGATAGLVARVPRIIMSARNVHPGHFPYLFRPWYRDAYRALVESPRVSFVANSQAGAGSYAAWLGLPVTRLQVVHNGFDCAELRPVPVDERPARRRALGLDPDAFLVVGVFRLSPEKRPLDFVAALDALRRRHQGQVRAVHLGEGPLEGVTRAERDRRGLGSVLDFLGRRQDPWSVMAVADALLLCSEQEGCPNVSLESQALGVPVVLTRGGGAAETVDDGRTGLVCDVGDVEGLAERLARLAHDPALRVALGAAGPAWIAARFGVAAMVERHLALYGAAEP